MISGGSAGGTAAIFDPSVAVTSTATIGTGGADDWHARASIKRRPSDNALVLTYYLGTSHAGNDGALAIRFSDDDGATWTAVNTALASDGGGAISGFPMNPPDATASQDAGEPMLYVCPNGDLLLHMWRVDYSTDMDGTYQSRSTDTGLTWSTPEGPIQWPGQSSDVNNRSFATDDDFVFDGVIYAGLRVYSDADGDPAAMKLITSDDNGVTWDIRSTIVAATEDSNHGGQEVGLEYVGNDTIIAMIRDNPHTKSFQRVSTDMGLTWGSLTDVTSTVGIAGRQRVYTRMHLQGEAGWWKDPRLVMTGFVHQSPPSSQTRRNAVWFSPDRGTTWDGPHYIDSSTEDAGYGDIFWDATNSRYVVVSYQGTLAAASLKQYNLTVSGI